MTRRFSLRAQLTWVLGTLALLILAVVGGYLGKLASLEIFNAQQAAVKATAQSAAEMLGNQLLDRERQVELLSTAPYLVDGPLDAASVRMALEQRLALYQEYAWIGVADAHGQVQMATQGMLVGRSVAEREWFIAGRERVFVGDVHEAKLLAAMMPALPNGEPSRFVDFAAPIRDAAGQLRGVVGSHAHWRWVTGIVESTVRRLHPDSEISAVILARDGRVLFPEGMKLAQLRGEAVLPSSLPEGRCSGTLRFGDGIEYLTAEATMNERTHALLGWRIVTRQPLQVALRPVDALQRQLVLLGILTATTLSLAALLLARRISRPMERLAEIARQVEAEHRVPEFPDQPMTREVAQLSEAMRSMTGSLIATEQQLQVANSSLEAQVLERTAELQAANAALERLATLDPLTGLDNRRSLDKRLVEALELDRRYGRQNGHVHALLLVDVDHFKRVNDVHGHPAGDAVLRQVAALLRGGLRASDVAARYGGEEFAVLLPEVSDPADATRAAEKIRAAIAAADFGVVGKLTVSIGVSLVLRNETSAAALIARADAALYEAKRAGRNQVVYRADA